MKKRILYVRSQYPQLTHTYTACEIEAVANDYELAIISLAKADFPYGWHRPHAVLPEQNKIQALAQAIRQFEPDVVHCHYLHVAEMAYPAIVAGDRPMTVRAHSFDILDAPQQQIAAYRFVHDDRCLGVLTFPFTIDPLCMLGYPEDKLISCWPVIDFKRFEDRRPNGEAVMNCGACIPKKAMDDFLALGPMLAGRKLSLYAVGHKIAELKEANARAGHPVDIIDPVEPRMMPAHYKRHEWLVYTATKQKSHGALASAVGWPMAVAEAMASGVGVCMPRVRQDLETYVGDAGYLYEDIREVPEIIHAGLPEEIRERGFEQARKSDVREHIHLLTDLWEQG